MSFRTRSQRGFDDQSATASQTQQTLLMLVDYCELFTTHTNTHSMTLIID